MIKRMISSLNGTDKKGSKGTDNQQKEQKDAQNVVQNAIKETQNNPENPNK
ncbi:unnamed protein product [Paramecium octaurelia]|uniref:Uncharacterized protein n=1 Tax=Paramecium octaurelia TaxID=43137 RepID=A0A8S1YPZ6_PAROT|nr:unnamed protein product [Paramecium octaurelia]